MVELDNRFVVTCESCGKKYLADPDKIVGDRAKYVCPNCKQVLTVVKPGRLLEPDRNDSMAAEPQESAADAAALVSKDTKGRPLGITGKFLLYTLLPFIALCVLLFFYSNRQTTTFSNETISTGIGIVNDIGGELISQISRSVARQTRLYLYMNPDLSKNDFNRDLYFKKVAIQRIGITGDTAVLEAPGGEGVWHVWASVNPKMVGVDLKSLKPPFFTDSPEFWRILDKAQKGEESSGSFKWQDEQGRMRSKFMVCTPVEGTPYIIAASIYEDEFTVPLNQLKAKGERLRRNFRNSIFIIAAIGFVVIGLIIFFSGRALTEKIKYLSHVAERISMGELNAEIKTRSKDEIGELADAIARMQDSIRLSVERLRRRKREI